ncbi:peptidylprolyl isomerase [soil metagenome]
MQIAENTVVRLRYRISDAQGEVVDDGEEPLTYLHGAAGEFFERISSVLEGQQPGFETTCALEPEDAFGDYDAELLRVLPVSELPAPLEVGMQFEGLPGIDEDLADRLFTVTDLTEDTAVLDGNHPLAGLALRVWVHVDDVRAATEVEIAQGHVDQGVGLTVIGDDEEDDDDDDIDYSRVDSPPPSIH